MPAAVTRHALPTACVSPDGAKGNVARSSLKAESLALMTSLQLLNYEENHSANVDDMKKKTALSQTMKYLNIGLLLRNALLVLLLSV